MIDLFTVAKFTATEMFKKKSFQITLIILLLIVIIGFNIPNIMNFINKDSSNNNDNENNKNIVLVIDHENIYQDHLNYLNDMDLMVSFKVSENLKTNEELNELILKNEIKAAIRITEEDENINLEYITESIGLTGNILVDSTTFSELYKVVKLKELGLKEEDIFMINTPLSFEITELTSGESGGILAVAMFICVILFFAIYYCAYQVSSSITVEKTSKIMDTLITSTSPKSIVVGKTLGIGFVGLVEIIILILTGYISYKLFFPAGLLENNINITNITSIFFLIAIIYFLLGYTFYAFIYALTGSLVSKPEDVQQSGGLVAFVVLIGFYLSYFSMINPANSLNKLATFLPISSPFSVPARYITGAISLSELILSIIILILSIGLIAHVAIKIYSSAILNYGTKFSFKTMIEMFKQDNN
ncbi:MAG: ABC transporter permease [Bacilli bacterium]|nr:ABC transporter permease [Bacilli bacterium]